MIDVVEDSEFWLKAETQDIVYSPQWNTTNAVASVIVTLNGEKLLQETDLGIYAWRPTGNGTYVFTHTVMVDGVVTGEVGNAVFVVTGLRPKIQPESGTVFEKSLTVSMSATSVGEVLRYTTDGSEPTMESPVYKRFRVTGKTMVKAASFNGRGERSEITVAEYALGRCEEPVIAPVDGAVFLHKDQEVSIAYEGDEGVVRYTLDGSEPTMESPVYEGPFTISETTTVKAKVFSDRWFDSGVVTAVLTRVYGVGEAMGEAGRAFETAGDAGFVRTENEGPTGGEAMHSGTIGDGERSVLTTRVKGPGTVRFAWRVSCEDDELDDWDHAEFVVDGVERLRRDGETGWETCAVEIAGAGEHTVEWRYVKDDVESEGADCLWVCGFEWESAFMKAVRGWYGADLTREQIEAKAKETAANGVNTVEEAYVIGIDPRDAGKRFVAGIKIDADGVVNVTWDPDLNEGGTKRERVYRVWGRETLEGGDWVDVTEGTRDEGQGMRGKMRFFKVTVEMP